MRGVGLAALVLRRHRVKGLQPAQVSTATMVKPVMAPPGTIVRDDLPREPHFVVDCASLRSSAR